MASSRQPHPVNKRLTFHETIDELDHIRHSSPMSSEFFVEGVQYQMAAVQELVSESGGNIEVESTEGCGTTLRVFLPVV